MMIKHCCIHNPYLVEKNGIMKDRTVWKLERWFKDSRLFPIITKGNSRMLAVKINFLRTAVRVRGINLTTTRFTVRFVWLEKWGDYLWDGSFGASSSPLMAWTCLQDPWIGNLRARPKVFGHLRARPKKFGREREPVYISRSATIW